MVGASRAVASKVGGTVVDGRERRATADNRCQPRALVEKKFKYLTVLESIEFCKFRTVPYGTIP